MRYLLFIMSVAFSGTLYSQTPYPILDSLAIEQVIQGKREVRWNTDYHRDSSNAFQPMRAVRMSDLLRKSGKWFVTVGDTILPINSLDTLFVQGLGGIVTGLLPGNTFDTLTIGIDSVQALPWYLTDGTDIEPITIDTVLFKGYGCVTVDVVPGSPDTVKITCLMPDGSETIVTAGTGISVTGVGTVGNPYIVTNTGDLSSSNELQTITATGAGPTSYNINLNLGGGDVTLLEGTGIDLTRSGNTITIASTVIDTDTDDQNLTIEGTGPSYTVAIDNGTDVIVSPGSGISLSESPANTLVITNTGDLSNTNELQTLNNTSDATTHTVTLSNSGGSVQMAEGSGITLTTTGTALDGIVTIAATDPSTTNEIQALTAGGAGPSSYTLDLSLGGGSVTLTEGAGVDLTRSGNTITVAAIPDGDGSSTNELQLLTATGAGPTNYNINLNLGGGDVTLQEGTGVDLTRTGNTITIASTIVDTDTDDQFLTLTGTGPNYTFDIDNGSDIIVAPGTGISLSESPANTLIITNTGDLSNTNELQTLNNTSDATSHTTTLSNSGGSTKFVEGTGITLTTTGTALDGIITIAAVPDGDGNSSNELQNLTIGGTGPNYSIDIDLGGTDVIIAAGSGITLSESPANTLIITNAGDADSNPLNEAWTVDADDADTEVITTQTVKFEGAGGITTDYVPATDKVIITGTIPTGAETIVTAGTGISVTGTGTSGNPYIVTNTGDLSNTNEIQTFNNTSDASSHTATLSLSGGSIKLVEGSLITLTTSGTALDGIITIASTADPSSTNEIQTISATGAGPTNYNINLSLAGGDVTLQEGTGIDLTRSGNTITIASTIVDTDTDDQNLTIEGTGPNYTVAIDNGTDVIVSAGSGITLSESPANTLVITNTGDLSNTNELQTLNNTSDATSHTVTLSNSGGSTQLIEGTGITLTTGGTALNGTVTISSTITDTDDQNLTIEGTGPNYTIAIDGGTDVIVAAGTGISLSESPANTLILTNTGDLSNTNEIQTLSASGAGPTSYNLDLSLSGGTVTLTEGTGINLTRSGNDITIAWTGTTLNGIYGDGTAGSGSSFLPPGGSVVDVDDDDPLIFDLDNAASQYNRMMRFDIAYSSDDAVTDVIAIITPHDSLKFISFDAGIQMQYAGSAARGLEIQSADELHLDADSIMSFSASIIDRTKLHYLAGYTANPELTYGKIAGTTNGQIMKWNSAGYWELGTDNAGGSGTITGGGTATRLAWWDGATSISSDAAAYWDNTNKRLGIGAGTTPSSSVDVTNTALGVSQTTTSGLSVVNTTVAANGAQQISPAIRWSGNGWKTNATAASQPVEFRSYVTPVQGTANPTGYLGFGSAINGSWTNDRWNFNSGGEVGFGTTTFSGSGAFARFNVTGSSGDFTPYLFNFYTASSSGGAVYGQLSNTQTASTTVFSLNESNTINSIQGGIRRYGSTHATRANEIELFNQPSASITMSTNSGVTRWTINNVGTVFQPGKLGAGQSSAAAVTSTLQTNSFGVAYLETVGAPTFDDTKHTVIYTANTNISWTIPTAGSCACAGRIYVLHHAGTAGVITLSNSVTKGNGGNFNTLNAGEWAYITYGSSAIRGYKLTSL